MEYYHGSFFRPALCGGLFVVSLFRLQHFSVFFIFCLTFYLQATVLFQIMDRLMKRSPADDHVYTFVDKRRVEGKPFAYKKTVMDISCRKNLIMVYSICQWY